MALVITSNGKIYFSKPTSVPRAITSPINVSNKISGHPTILAAHMCTKIVRNFKSGLSFLSYE